NTPLGRCMLPAFTCRFQVSLCQIAWCLLSQGRQLCDTKKGRLLNRPSIGAGMRRTVLWAFLCCVAVLVAACGHTVGGSQLLPTGGSIANDSKQSFQRAAISRRKPDHWIQGSGIIFERPPRRRSQGRHYVILIALEKGSHKPIAFKIIDAPLPR